MTVADLESRLTVTEEMEWVDYHRLLGEEHEAAMKKATQKTQTPTKKRKTAPR